MRVIVTLAILAALPLALAMAAGPRAAFAASQDGNWSVLVITEQGTCDRGYRYSVNVANGRVVYQGDAAVSLNGTVAPNGAVKVSIKGGDKDASGTGRLSANTGSGTWRGSGSAGTCTGSWEAERR
jgi:hypothetical protein